MSESEQFPLAYACSGASSAAQMANHIAGVGGDVKPLVKTALSGRLIIALDGLFNNTEAGLEAIQVGADDWKVEAG